MERKAAIADIATDAAKQWLLRGRREVSPERLSRVKILVIPGFIHMMSFVSSRGFHVEGHQ